MTIRVSVRIAMLDRIKSYLESYKIYIDRAEHGKPNLFEDDLKELKAIVETWTEFKETKDEDETFDIEARRRFLLVQVLLERLINEMESHNLNVDIAIVHVLLNVLLDRLKSLGERIK